MKSNEEINKEKLNIEEEISSNQKSHKSKGNKKESNTSQNKINEKVENFGKKINLSKEIIEKVKTLSLKVIDEKKLKQKLYDNTIASVIFIACRNAEEPKTMQEIASQLELDKKGVNKCYNLIKDTIEENKNQIPQTVSGLINNYCDKLINKDNSTLKNISVEIGNNVCKYELIAGRNPNTIAAACILIGAKLLNLKDVNKKFISKNVGTTENTISNAYNVLMEYKNSIVPDEYKNNINLLDENNK